MSYLSMGPVEPLPHPPLDDRAILAIEIAMRLAWNTLVSNSKSPINLGTADEESITEQFELTLDKIRRNKKLPFFTEEYFEQPTRGQRFRNYDGSTINKQPDLVIRMCGTRDCVCLDWASYDALFIECKLIDSSTQKGINLYAKHGINRFIIGDYAWAMPHAMMVAYVRTSETLPKELNDYFRKDGNSQYYKLKKGPNCCLKSNIQPHIFITTHSRPWKYESGSKAGDIDIRHLWLSTTY